MSLSILVTDGGERSALAAVRSLGRAGHRVYVCYGDERSLAGASGYAREAARVASPTAEPDRMGSDVADLVRRWDVEMVLPVTDESLQALLPRRDSLDGAELPFPGVGPYRRISNKALAAEVARRVGLAVPKQQIIPRPGVDPDPDAPVLDYPVVVKPARSVTRANDRLVTAGVRTAADEGEMRSLSRRIPRALYPLLIQERVEGTGTGVFLLRWDGETRAAFQHRRIREKPPGGGVSVYRESVRLDAALRSRCEAILEHFEWEGPAMVELKEEEGTGIPHLMEVNARFWGSLQLAVDAGVDFPALLASSVEGAPPGELPDYRVGVRSRWWWGEVDHLLTRLRRNGNGTNGGVPPTTPPVWRGLFELIRPSTRWDRTEVLRLSDPAPFVRESAAWLRRHAPGIVSVGAADGNGDSGRSEPAGEP